MTLEWNGLLGRAEVNPIIVISYEDAMQSCLKKLTMILVFNGLYVINS